MIKGAYLSGCGRYRYALWRMWDSEQPYLPFVMLNPSTADAEYDDPTIRRCLHFARRESYGGLYVLNLFAWRATDPADLVRLAPGEAIGPDNALVVDEVGRRLVEWLRQGRSVPVVCAWGAHPLAADRGTLMRADLVARGMRPVCLGRTKAGAPRHPLYVPNAQQLEVW